VHEHAAPPYWALAPEALLARLEARPAGLSQAEAAARLARVGPNLLTGHTERETLRLLARQLASPLVLILVFGAIVSLVLSDWVDAAIVIVIVVASSLLGFWQERRAASAVAALRQRLALTVRVQRDGSTQTVQAASIVPGDLVLLSAGNLVPADGVVIDARDFLVVESSLTGESFPVEKRPGVLPADTRQGARTNSVFLGTSVRSGTASVLVTGTASRPASPRPSSRGACAASVTCCCGSWS
jgi:Mg2+-importing ATPase